MKKLFYNLLGKLENCLFNASPVLIIVCSTLFYILCLFNSYDLIMLLSNYISEFIAALIICGGVGLSSIIGMLLIMLKGKTEEKYNQGKLRYNMKNLFGAKNNVSYQEAVLTSEKVKPNKLSEKEINF